MRTIFPAFLFLLTLAAPALAEPEEAAPPATEEHHHSRFSAAIGPAWVHVLRDNYTPAFTGNGFSAPGRDRIGLDLLGYWTTDTRWQIGLGVTAVSLEQNLGTSAADYANDVVGLYVARNLSQDPEHDFTLGALFGMNEAELTVFSNAQNGRLRETSAMVAPSVGYASRVSRLIKLGARASYAIPFGESVQANGQTLGVTRIGIRGFSLAVQVIFGK